MRPGASTGRPGSGAKRHRSSVPELPADPVQRHAIDTHLRAVDLARSHDFSFHDALIVASAHAAGCDTLLTEDFQAGRRIAGLTIVNPFA